MLVEPTIIQPCKNPESFVVISSPSVILFSRPTTLTTPSNLVQPRPTSSKLTMNPRFSCLFCGTLPESGKKVCARHSNYVDMTAESTTPSALQNKRDLEEVDDFAVPHLNQGREKKKTRGAVRECMICMEKFRSSGVSCGNRHHSCKTCTKGYIEKTLPERGPVWFDFVPCMDPECFGFLPSKEVQRMLTKKSIETIEKRQMDLSYLLAGEVDPSSQKVMSDKTRPCPNCKVPIEKYAGCSKMKCAQCGHVFWYDCNCTNFPFHEEGCSESYPVAHV